ncbi:MAG TPA: response regulator [Dehalococcoidia bacterium]|nr:response regulator [Dehalococcoidia bacterium]
MTHTDAGRTVLIVDDEPVVRALLRAALEPTGSRLIEAADGCEAVTAAWRDRPDLVLLDVGLPKLNGFDACRAIKTKPAPPRVLLITGNADLPELETCGADGLLEKPFDPFFVAASVSRELDIAAGDAA